MLPVCKVGISCWYNRISRYKKQRFRYFIVCYFLSYLLLTLNIYLVCNHYFYKNIFSKKNGGKAFQKQMVVTSSRPIYFPILTQTTDHFKELWITMAYSCISLKYRKHFDYYEFVSGEKRFLFSIFSFGKLTKISKRWQSYTCILQVLYKEQALFRIKILTCFFICRLDFKKFIKYLLI